MAAIDPLLVKQKDGPEKINFVSCRQVYGGTFQHFSVREDAGAGYRVPLGPAPLGHPGVEGQIDEDTRFLYMEALATRSSPSPTSRPWPTLAHSCEIPLIIDATCATPALMRPIAHGADIVVHSLTKSITSGGFAIGGALISRKPITTKVRNDNPLFKESFAEYVKFLPYRDNGPAASPVNAIFALNDLRTLRVQDGPRQPELPDGGRVPPDAPQGLPGRLPRPAQLPPPRRGQEIHDARRLRTTATGGEVNRYGHLMSFRVDGPPANARKVFDGFKMIFRATDLGPDQERRHHPGHLDPPAAGRGGAAHGRRPAPAHPALRRGRAPGRRHRRPRPGPQGARPSAGRAVLACEGRVEFSGDGFELYPNGRVSIISMEKIRILGDHDLRLRGEVRISGVQERRPSRHRRLPPDQRAPPPGNVPLVKDVFTILNLDGGAGGGLRARREQR